MRKVRALCSFAIVAAAFGCGGSKEEAKAPAEPTAAEGQMPPQANAEPGMNEVMQAPPPPAQAGTGQAAPAEPPAPAPVQLSSNDLMMGSISCILGPVMHSTKVGSSDTQGESMGPSAGASNASSGSMSGPNSDRCMTTAKAANISPAALYSGDPAAIDSVRKTIDARLSAEGASSDAANSTLALYDKGMAASKEARSAHESLALLGEAQQAMRNRAGSAGAPKAGAPKKGGASAHGGAGAAGQGAIGGQTADTIRAHTALSDLYQYGRGLGATESGTQAQALAWVIGANRFMDVNQVPSPAKSLVAEPLFAALLNVPAPAPAAGRQAPAWNEYLAAAARSVSATSGRTGTGQAVGGGPGAMNEKANLEQVVKTTEDHMQVLGQQLPFTSPLRGEVDRTMAGLNMVEATAPATPPPATKGGTTPKKPAPSQAPKK